MNLWVKRFGSTLFSTCDQPSCHRSLNILKTLVLLYFSRNLLQDVLRNWHAKAPYIVENCKQLVENAWKCVEAFKAGKIQICFIIFTVYICDTWFIAQFQEKYFHCTLQFTKNLYNRLTLQS